MCSIVPHNSLAPTCWYPQYSSWLMALAFGCHMLVAVTSLQKSGRGMRGSPTSLSALGGAPFDSLPRYCAHGPRNGSTKKGTGLTAWQVDCRHQ